MQDLVDTLTAALLAKKMKLVTAESCTGGLLATIITHKPGASKIFERGFVTYSNESKTDLLGIETAMLDKYGAVSGPGAEFMARGALDNSRADLAASITGIAGPDGATPDKPVGLVFFGYAFKGGSAGSTEHRFTGSRTDIQAQAATSALKHLLSVLNRERL
ncbi:MAG: CinA family protein [Alphaproteobacteria bacterium]|nr:CinA family protein [Alphaproteobacteria bacterium]